jgi:lysyl-tRNA synthetase class 2
MSKPQNLSAAVDPAATEATANSSLPGQFAQRLRKVEELRASGVDPYANDFVRDTPVVDFLRLYADASHTAETLHAADDANTAPQHALAGRVVAINSFGKAAFLRLVDGSDVDGRADAPAPTDASAEAGKLQIYVRRDRVPEADWAQFKQLDLGDFVGVHGVAMRTKTGEISVAAQRFRLLTKALRPLPEKWHGLADVQTRYRQRYLDLLVNPPVRRTFVARSRILSWLRQYFTDRGFLEVETPMLHGIAGGAAARPFKTHHNALNMEMYLRVAPELHLKRLVVGGLPKVFEINRNFRNEGVSTVHNPEFTMLEFYQAYATHVDLLDQVEEIVVGAGRAIAAGSAATQTQAEAPDEVLRVDWEGHSICLQRPFARMTMLEAIAHHGGPAAAASLDPAQAAAALRAAGQDPSGRQPGQLIVDLFEHFAEPKLVQPTFITEFPVAVSPLSRKQAGNPDFVDRFELYVAGRELANAFSELNDPVDQQARFTAQQDQRAAGDEEAHAVDGDFVRALEHGMPPTAGCGIGVDRLVMLLTGAASIRDVILFPVLRPER